MAKTPYYNINIDIFDTPGALLICREFLNSVENHLIYFINAHCFNLAQKDHAYLNALNTAEIVLNDGIGISLGARHAGVVLKENMNGTDFIPKLLELAGKEGKNVYLLGGKEGIASNAKLKVEQKYPELKVCGCRNGYFDFYHDDEVIKDIVDKKTDLLIVGMGVPRQELWLAKNKDRLTGVKISIAGGAILDFISENVVRAPKWMRKTGTEWVFRLLQEPVRLFKRYAIGIPLFYYYIYKLKK